MTFGFFRRVSRSLLVISLAAVMAMLVLNGFADNPASGKSAVVLQAGNTILVNSTSDSANGTDGLCTLREAITAANSNTSSGVAGGECSAGSASGSDTIDLSGVSGTITLISALPTVTSNVAINGPSSSVLTIVRNSGATFSGFSVGSTATASISGLSLEGGAPATGSGTGVANSGTLTLDDCHVSGFGLGVSNVSLTLTISNSVISGNDNGGGVSNSQGTINISNTQISGNSSNGLFGPGIANSSGAIHVTNSTITNNNGHIAVHNGSSATATLVNTTVSNNPNGGFINHGKLFMTGGLITGNTQGGLIAGGTAVIDGVTISNNSNNSGAFIGGGGLVINGSGATVMNCLITNNSTTSSGGGVRNAGGKVVFINTTISNNTANIGGGLYIQDGGLGDTVAINVTITGNKANVGGGVFRNSGPVKFKNSLIAGNTYLNGFTPFNIGGAIDPLSSFNLIGPGGAGGLTNGVNNNQVDVAEARLGPLANNGGPTLTHALLSDSPALDAADNCVTQPSHCGEPKFLQITKDQRGFSRIVDGPDANTTATVDIGAFEAQLTLANLPDISINEDTQVVVPFDPGDPGTITSVTASSSNTALVSNDPAHLSAALVGSAGIVTINPIAEMSGTTNITVTVNRTGGSDDKTFLLTVNAVNDTPSFTKGSDQAVNEDAGAQTVPNWAASLSAGPSNESGQVLSFHVTNNTNASLFSSGPGIDSSGTLTYTPAANAHGSATITIVLTDDGGTANGGVDTSESQAFTILVSQINDAPTFTKGSDPAVNEDAGPQFISNWATNISSGPSDPGQALTFAVTDNTNAGLFALLPSVNSAGGLSFTPAANASGSATITIELSDTGGVANGGANTSPTQNFTITVNAVNDAPSFTKGANQFVNNDAGLQTINNWATSIVAGPGDESGQNVSFVITSNSNPSLFAVAPSVSPAGTLSYDPASGVDGVATLTISLEDDGGTANGGDNSSASESFTITVLPAGAALPLALVVNALGDAADASVGDGACDTDAGTVGDQCTLRAAIEETNSAATDDAINFSLPASSTIILDTALPDITGNLNINGPGASALTVQRNTAGGTPDFRIFMISSGVTVAVSGLTIANGNLTGVNNGGGVRNDGTLTLTNCHFFGNNVEQVGGAIFNSGTAFIIDCQVGGTSAGQPNIGTNGGGGIYNNAGALTVTRGSVVGNSSIGLFVAGGTATIDGVAITNNSSAVGGGGITAVVSTNIVNSLIADNTASAGGGIFNQGSSTTITNSTISGNAASTTGGGVRNSSGTLVLTNVTVTNNRAIGSVGGGISVSGTVNLRNTIVAANFQGASPSTTASDISGFISPVNSFNNVIGIGGAGGLGNFNGNQVSVFDTRMGPLADNGGSTKTHALLVGSPAMDRGSNTFVTNPPFSGSAPFNDQRGAGFKRILDAGDLLAAQTVDVGAYEAHPMIEDLSNSGMSEDVPLACRIYNVGDDSEGLLSVVATSSNQTLIRDVNINANLPDATGSRCLAITPEPNQFGSTTVTLTLTSTSGRSVTDSFVLTVNAMGDAPSVTPASTNEDTQTTSGLVITPNALDSSEITQFRITNILNGTLFHSNGFSTISANSSITRAEGAAGLKFTPAADLNSSSSSFGFTVQAMTSAGVPSAGTGTDVTIQVNPVNDAPSFTKGPDPKVNQQAGGFTIPNWATNVSPGAANESAQTLTFQVLSNSNSGLFSVPPAIDSSGTLTFTGAPGVTGTAIITINLIDNGGTALGGQDTSPPQMFNITITPPPVSLVVNTLGDASDINVGDRVCDSDPVSGDQCTLRAAIQETNATGAASGNAISFALTTPAVITLNTALPEISTSLTITGPGANSLTVQRSSAGGTPNFRIFTINSGLTVGMSDLTISNGNVVGSFPANAGAGILNSGTLTLTEVMVSGNTAAGSGGGIYVDQGTLNLNNSIITGNSAGSGGGVFALGTTTIDLSTIKNNSVSGNGAGLLNASGNPQPNLLTINRSTISNNISQGSGGGLYNSGHSFITNSTISSNSASQGGGITNANTMTLKNLTITANNASSQGGGMQALATVIAAGNTIIAGNTSPSGPDCSATVNSSDYNLIGNTSGASFTGTTTHNITNVSPALGPLADNGGPTFTHALLSGSPAIDAGNNAAITNPPFIGPPFTDQRGEPFNRIADGDGNSSSIVDIGAYEKGPLSIDTLSPAAGRTSGGQQIQLTGAFANLSTVTMGGVSATWSYTNGAGDTSAITVTTPAHAVGAVQIDLAPTSGSPYSKPNAFAYLPTVFTDDTLVVGQTTSKAQHIIELRQAVDALRAVAGLSAATWTDPTLSPTGTIIKAVHIVELRSYLDDVAMQLGYATSPYTDSSLGAGSVIKRIHIEELRQRIRTIAG
ncbi:MAG TPA: choice-of-anchor Q domain-containing protein [Pyrinomonadaceae bacterium]|nr:choice-of-anchor Q domain-containing protein [Pyrinomonadaceae bacterium]